MSRSLKNVLTTIILLVLVAASAVTVYLARAERTVPDTDMFGGMIPGMGDNLGEMPDMPNGGFQGDAGEIPDMPDGDFQGDAGEMPNDGIQEITSEDMGMGMMQMGRQNGMPGISVVYYILFVVLALAEALVIMYLVMSAFHSRNFKETFLSKDKVIIYVLSSILVTQVLVIIQLAATFLM